ncbi:MAG: metal ABC transporter permease [Holosporaceae bacterium]
MVAPQGLGLVFFGGALLAGMSGPLGAFLVWKRMAYVADAFAHAALLAGVVAALLSLPAGLSFILFTVISALLVTLLLRFFVGKEDTLLLLFAMGAMSLGLWLMSAFDLSRGEIMGFLAGNPLKVTSALFFAVLALACLVVVFLLCKWDALVSFVIAEDLARVEGIAVQVLRVVFFIFVFLLILLGIQWAGALFLSMLFVCPLLTVQPWVKKPQWVLVSASIWGVASYGLGFMMWQQASTALGPVLGVVLMSGALLSQGIAWLWRLCVEKKGVV